MPNRVVDWDTCYVASCSSLKEAPMSIRRAICGFRLSVVPARRVPDPPLRPRILPELPQVNARAGTEPVRPELSGLRLHTPAVPRRAARLLNVRLRHSHHELEMPPPILTYPVAEPQVRPTRLQPMLDPEVRDGPLRELPRDVSDLDWQRGPRRARVLQPRVNALEPEDLLAYRPILPKQYRQFLRHSPYPRVAAVSVA